MRLPILDAVERALSSTIESGPLRLFRARLEPVHIVRKLERILEQHALVCSRGTVVPHELVLRLHPTDAARLTAAGHQLPEVLSRQLERAIRRRRHTLLGPITLQIKSDSMVRQGQVQADVTRLPSNLSVYEDPIAATAPLAAARARPTVIDVTLPGSDPVSYSQQLIRFGRGVENDVVILDPQVSRCHAELRIENGSAELRDLESTNGTWVTGRRIAVAPITRALQVTLGNTEIQLQARLG
ncbi:MAG: FhaA domain-containing protein [Chloroflexota bacterium]